MTPNASIKSSTDFSIEAIMKRGSSPSSSHNNNNHNHNHCATTTTRIASTTSSTSSSSSSSSSSSKKRQSFGQQQPPSLTNNQQQQQHTNNQQQTNASNNLHQINNNHHHHHQHHHHQTSIPPIIKASPNEQQTNINNTISGSKSIKSQSVQQVECHLENRDLWERFHDLGTEMIITKTGRRMFPTLRVSFSDTDPNARYAISMDIVPVDHKRYRYAYHKSCWQVAGKADPSSPPRLYQHPDSPFNGDQLRRQVISFEKVKLTNNDMDKQGHIILNSMHKYQPRVHIVELKSSSNNNNNSCASNSNNNNNNYHRSSDQVNHALYVNAASQGSHHSHNNHLQQQQQQQIEIEGLRTFEFPETVFTAVTAYQNQLITKLKIDSNPFAKGFRDSSRLTDLDRNDSLDYGGSMMGGHHSGDSMHHSAMAAAAAAAASLDANQMEMYQLLNPWYQMALSSCMGMPTPAGYSGGGGGGATGGGGGGGGGLGIGVGPGGAGVGGGIGGSGAGAMGAIGAALSLGGQGGQGGVIPAPNQNSSMPLPPNIANIAQLHATQFWLAAVNAAQMSAPRAFGTPTSALSDGSPPTASNGTNQGGQSNSQQQ